MKTARLVSKLLVSSFIYFTFISAFSACSAKTNDFGADADYFIGLQKLAQGNTKDAASKFNRCIKKGTYECARKSAIELTKIGNLQDKNQACLFLIKQFPDSETKLIAAKQFKESNEINKIIEITDGIDLETESNQLIKIRLEAMKQRKDSRFEKEAFTWFMCRTISQEHYQFYRDSYNEVLAKLEAESAETVSDENSDNKTTADRTDKADGTETALIKNPKYFAIEYRILIYRRNYLEAFDKAATLFDFFESKELNFYGQLASDIGKAYLYGNDNFVTNAAQFRKLAETYKNTEAEFYLWFYAGRLYDMAALYYSQSITCFSKAFECTAQSSKKDNALWYLLKAKSKLSLDDTLKVIGDYAKQWSDPEYFDDFFDNLIPSLLVSGKWSSFGPLLSEIDGYASNEITARVAYLYGRLLEEDYITAENKGAEVTKAYERALNCGTAGYYKLLAAHKLNASPFQTDEIIKSQSQNNRDKNWKPDAAAETLLKGYAYFGFPEKIYDEWLKSYKDKISVETSMYLADFLKKCGKQNNNYICQSLRIASRSANVSERPLSFEELKLVYPENFSSYVSTYCQKYGLPDSVMYALIRSESFFDSDITSSAGAVGLTQLMELTGSDIARKLKIKDYSLTDPETNINFGTFYLAELYRRTDNRMLNAFFSYNAGITKVRNWLNASIVEFGKRDNMSGDLFLETIPYSETREYGRKLVNATIMYEYLYGNSEFNKTVENLIK